MLSMKKGDNRQGTAGASKPLDFDVMVGSQSVIEGNIRSQGSVRIDGQVRGNIHAEGDVYIGQTADCKGTIVSHNLEISGRVQGNITATGGLKIYATGILLGDIEVTSFFIDEGGVFEGLCHINTQRLKTTESSVDIHEAI